MRRLLTLLLACLLAVAPLAGCGDDDVDPDALAEAAAATSRHGTVHMTIDMRIDSPRFDAAPVHMEGDADLKRRRMRMTVDLGHLAEELGGGADADELQMEQIMVGTTVYMRMPALSDAIGAEWAKFDLQEAGEEAGFDFEQMMQMSAGNSPAEQLEYLRATTDLEKVGTEDVGGARTTHYTGEVDLHRAAEVLPTQDRERTRKTMDRLVEMLGGSTYPVEIWIDDDLLVRRQRVEMSIEKPEEMEMEMDMRFSDFGKPVDIEAPTGDVKDITDITSGQGQAGPLGPGG